RHTRFSRDWSSDVCSSDLGTRREGERVVTDGGRVLGVTALAPTLPEAIERAYAAVEKIRFEGAYYRRDIGAKALRRGKDFLPARSEERRVGTEGRGGGWEE